MFKRLPLTTGKPKEKNFFFAFLNTLKSILILENILINMLKTEIVFVHIFLPNENTRNVRGIYKYK
jgi:hypothetical protein